MSSIYDKEPYRLSHVSTCEEGLQTKSLEGWRRYRIEYRDENGFSNLEGCIYFPPEFDPYPLLDEICDRLNNVVRRDNDS